jgi:hypothetical protein
LGRRFAWCYSAAAQPQLTGVEQMKKTNARKSVSITEPNVPGRTVHLVPSDTPWGKVQTAEDVAPGITRISTASHGGYRLNSVANAKVDPVLKKLTCGGLGLKGWYEEDCDWAIVVYTFKEHFDPIEYELAVESLKQNHKEAWKHIQKSAK